MPAPKRANTVAATWAARDATLRRGLVAAADKLRAAGGEVVLPFAWGCTDQHSFRIESRSAGERDWKADAFRGGEPIWYTPAAAALRLYELESRGLQARTVS